MRLHPFQELLYEGRHSFKTLTGRTSAQTSLCTIKVIDQNAVVSYVFKQRSTDGFGQDAYYDAQIWFLCQ